jgi:predicted ATPase
MRVSFDRDEVEDWDSYPFSIPVIGSFEGLEIASRVLFFVGENGSGKSTLLEALALACGFGPEGGSRNFRFSTREEERDEWIADEPIVKLAAALRLSWRGTKQRDGFFLRAESFYNVATYLDRLGGQALEPYGGISLHERSHGESFLALFLERFSGAGLYLLDEPEAALSTARQLALLARMHDLLAADPQAQFLIATHSPILLAFPGAQICSFDGVAIHPIDYRLTDAYLLTRRFIDDPERALRELFES